ncbi:MAG: hypothetical protein CSB47_01915 [Proteobacteria bacterium]|nr:MAG: hypothetical protein CSB47_01915 [Pseudomonadota bacterium]
MKLKTLAIAIAMGAVPFAAQADLKIGGDITVGYFNMNGTAGEVRENGSEINIDASQKVGGTTFYGHTELDFQGTGSAAEFEEVRVGAKGRWGEFILGETDNGCDATDVGGTDEVWLAHTQGGCMGSDENNVVYKRDFRRATVAVSHNPNGTGNNNHYNAIGVKGKLGPVAASLGYEKGDGIGANGGKNIALGLDAEFGRFSVGMQASQFDPDTGSKRDAAGLNLGYKAGANFFYGGFGRHEITGSTDKVKSWSVGYNRSVGSNTTLIVEAGKANTDTEDDVSYALGMKHAF